MFIKVILNNKQTRNNTAISMIKDYYAYYIKNFYTQKRKNAKTPKEKYTKIIADKFTKWKHNE